MATVAAIPVVRATTTSSTTSRTDEARLNGEGRRARETMLGVGIGPILAAACSSRRELPAAAKIGPMPTPSMVSRALRATTIQRPRFGAPDLAAGRRRPHDRDRRTHHHGHIAPIIPRRGHAHRAAISYAAWNRTVLDTPYRLTSGSYPGDPALNGECGPEQRPRFGHSTPRPRGDGRLRRGWSAPRGPIRVSQLPEPDITFACWWPVPATEARTGQRATGHSEHQLGTALDFRSYGDSHPGLAPIRRDEGRRLAPKNAWKYGFVMATRRASERHLLRLRAVALPIHGSIRSGEGAQQRADTAAIPSGGGRRRVPRHPHRPHDIGAERSAE